jgi:cell wall-associated NlpC family hydrolase
VPATPVPTAAPTHQSVVLGAVQGSAGPAHQTLSGLQIQDQHAAAGGGNANLSEAAAFDPNAPGGLPDTSDTYPGDNAPPQEIAAWMGRQAHKAGLPAELPIMAALTESGLKNVNYGDRDSLGFFQMRTSIWNQGPYAGFPDHPELQLKWFINQALEVRKERIAQGDASYGQDKSKWGDWVADVEQPAAEYRGRYATHLDQADQLLAQAGPPPPPAAGGVDPAAAADALGGVAVAGGAAPVALHALAIAESFKGTPYHWGGNTPQTGFDCSGLVQWSYHQAGIDLGRVTTDQFAEGVHIPTVAQLKPGDIVFFQDSTGYIHHEGIYIGGPNHLFLHAPHTGDVVKVSSLDESYYAGQFAGGSDVSGLAHGAVPPATPPPAAAAPTTPPPAAAAPAAPATPAPAVPAAADAAESSDGGAADSLLGAVENPPEKTGPHSTVQILPAVEDPNAKG